MQLDKTIELKSVDQLLEIQTQDDPYVLYISTQDCNVCKAIHPKMVDVINNQMPIYSIDASVTPEISGQLLVFSVPTIILMNQQREVYRESRFIQFEQFKERVDWVLNN